MVSFYGHAGVSENFDLLAGVRQRCCFFIVEEFRIMIFYFSVSRVLTYNTVSLSPC